MNPTSTIVLVGGSGLGPWAWQRVTPILNRHGFQTVTPQLRTTGEDRTPAKTVTLDDWVEDLSAAVSGLADAILVAHSFAGYVAAALLERQPRSIRKLIFLDAVLPQPGRSWFDVMGPDVAGFMTSLASDGATPWFTREQLDQMYPGHGIVDADFAWMKSHLTPQPIATYANVSITKPLETATANVAYVRCLRVAPPAADLTTHPGWEHRTLDAGHWPMITDPAETAQVIIELARS
ncbi:salicylate esterase [Labilithrix luteola]|uniref:Salicylate esterase n=1 Tax=Labilithrix luteola TaxID=1391654 RepID=A0A0K1PQC0_9BACT|nr:alpha/beta fold hydrolase [Labilithrix luteola]AKU95735.1 salicylate esterase [Labilithrix luteola]